MSHSESEASAEAAWQEFCSQPKANLMERIEKMDPENYELLKNTYKLGFIDGALHILSEPPADQPPVWEPPK